MSPPRRRRPAARSRHPASARSPPARAPPPRRRHGAVVAVAAIVALAAVAGVGGTAGVLAYGSSCDLDSLQSGRHRREHVRLRRRREPARLDPGRAEPRAGRRRRTCRCWIRKATIAIEDRRFFEHDGVDVEGIARAAVENLRAGEIVEGGSTITQQLVRNLYISREQTVQRKVKEACLATKLDRAWTKERILTTYLNQVYYGNRAYGIEAAAQTYFSKPAKDLTLSEAALLAGLTQAPSVYDPFTSPARALARRQEVLRAMLDTRRHHARGVPRRRSTRGLGLRRGRLYERDPRALLLRLRPRQAHRGVRRRRRFARAASRSTRRSSRATSGSPRRRSATR